MAKYVCSVCGYIYEGDTLPERCPECKVPSTCFSKRTEEVNTNLGHVDRNTSISKSIVQGVSVVAINVVSEGDIAPMVQQEVSKEIAKLNAQGKRVVNVSSGSAVKNVLGVKHHVIILWEKI